MLHNERSPISLFSALAHQVLRSRRWVILLWGMIVLASLALTPHLERSLQGAGMTYNDSEAQRTERLIQQELNFPADPLTLVFQTDQGLTIDQAQPDIQRLLTQVEQVSAEDGVFAAQAFQSRDRQTQYNILSLQEQGSAAVPTIEKIEQVLDQNPVSKLKVYVTGKAVVDRDAQMISQADLSRAELIALPMTLGALIFVFGSVVAAPLPVVMALVTVSVTFGMLYFVAQQMQMSVLALNFSSMLGLGLGIDYSLLIVNRFREELTQGDTTQAIKRTLDTAGRAVFVSGLTDCISLVCLLFFPISLLRSIGLAGCIVVFVSILVALTLLPVLLSLIGPRINWGRRVIQPFGPTQGAWRAIAHFVMRHSVPIMVFVLALVLIFVSPFLRVHFGLGDASILPPTVASRQGVEQVTEAFGPGEITPILLTLQPTDPTDSIWSPQHLATIDPVVTQLSNDPRVASVTSILNLVPGMSLSEYQQLYQQPVTAWPPPLAASIKTLSNDSTQLIVIRSRSVSHDQNSLDLVKELRSLSLNGLKIQVGGQTANEIDTLREVSKRFPWVLGGIMVVTFGVLSLLFQSVVLPLKAIVMNFLSIGASFGALVFIFQEGNLKNVLNFTPLGYIDILLPLVLFCVVFGLSMDYEVFLLTRIKEAYDHCGNNAESVATGLEQTGGMITSAAGLMMIVTGAFMLTNIIFMKALGLGIALAVLIDSTLIRVLFVPATMHLMGKWNWWFPFKSKG